MRNINKFLLFATVLLLVSLGTISASDNQTGSSQNMDISPVEDINNNVDIPNQEITGSDSKTVEKNKMVEKNNQTIKEAASTITVTQKNYDQFFINETGTEFVKSTDLIRNGDTVNLKGTFKNVKFAVDKKITFTSVNKDAKLYNSTVYVLGQGASGSTISNLYIDNDGTLLKGIQVKNSSNLIIKDNNIKTLGLRAYGFVADHMTNSLITSNSFEREGDDWRYITFVIGKSNYNTITNNTIHCGGANGIYLSIYGSSEANFDGGTSDYNNITYNTINAKGYITSWCYTIQVMGANNFIAYNKVTGGFRGISTQDYVNNTIIYNDVHAINEGIYACEKAIVKNNNVHVDTTATGISIGGNNVLVRDNIVSSESGQCINIYGNNPTIINNTLTSTYGYGIYSKGTYTNILIENNRINTEKEGILFKQQTKTKKINHVKVNRNNIVSQADYAINFEETGSQVDYETNITVSSSNVLTSKKGKGLTNAYLKPANAIDNTELDSNQVVTITASNYDDWFENGVANIKIKQNATVYLKGTFKNVDFTFNKKVHIIGQKCVINHGTITLTGDAHASTIKDVTIKNNNKNDLTRHAIELLEVNSCEITSVTIYNYAQYESLGLFLYGSNGNTISKSTIKTDGDYVNNGILLYSSDSNTISANKVKISQSNVRVPYADSIMFNEKIGTIQEILHNHGIVAIYSSYNVINKNIITGTSKFTKYTYPTNDCKNSIVGIDIYFDSHHNQVLKNTVKITSYGPYVYGIGVLGGYWGSSITSLNATGNIYHSNNITLTAGYFGTGFIAGRNSVDTVVKLNTFKIVLANNDTKRGDYAHGITLENSTGSTIAGNNISASGCAVYAIELFDSHNNQISKNGINSIGTNPRALAAYRSTNSTITANQINLKKVNFGFADSSDHGDVITEGDEAIILMANCRRNNITGNLINTNASIAVRLTDLSSNNIVTENSLKAKKVYENKAVLNQGTSNRVSNNFVYFVNATVSPVKAMIGDTIVINVTVVSTTSNLKNLKVTYKIGTEIIGTASVVNGKSRLVYTIPTLYTPTVYYITAEVSGKYFQNASVRAKASFTKAPDATIVSVYEVLKPVGYNATLYANITTSNGGKISSGKAQFYLDGVYLFTKNVNLGRAFGNYEIASNATAGVHNIKVVYLGTNDFARSEGSNILGIQTKSAIAVKAQEVAIGEVNQFYVVLKSGNHVDKANVTFYIDAKKIGMGTVKNGKLYYNYTIPTSLDKGVHTLKVVYDGNATTTKASREITFNVKAITPTFKYNNTRVNVGAAVSLVLAIDNGLTGSKYYQAKSGNVTVQLNGKTLTDSNGKAIVGTVKDGIIRVKFTAPEQLKGYNNITFVYSGNEKFDSKTQVFKNALYIE